MPEVGTFRCEVFTPDGPVAQVEALAAVFPAVDGLVGVLPGRMPLLAALGSGSLLVRTRSGGRHFLVGGGFAHMRGTLLTVLTEKCEPETGLTPRWLGEGLDNAPARARAAAPAPPGPGGTARPVQRR